MNTFRPACVAFVLCLPAVADAGQVYGTIVLGGQGIKNTAVEIQCGKEDPITVRSGEQ